MAKTKIEVDLVIKGGESVEQVENKTKSLKAQLKEMKALLASGTLDSETFNKLSRDAGELQDKIGDVSSRVKNLASDSQKLDALMSAAQGLVGGFAAVQGVAAMLGDENEELQATMVKLQGAMSALAGIQAVANTLNKESALSTNLLGKANIFNSIQTGVATAAQTVYTAAVGASTGAMKAFRIALLASGIGIVVALLGAAAYAMSKFGADTDKTNEKLERLKKIREDLNEQSKKDYELRDANRKAASDGALQLKRELDLLIAKGATEKEIYEASRKLKQRERDDINDQIGSLGDSIERTQQLKDKANEMDVLDEAYKKSIRDKAEADKKKSEEEAKKRREQDLQERIKRDQEALKDAEQLAKTERENLEELANLDKQASDKEEEDKKANTAFNLAWDIEQYKFNKAQKKKIEEQALADQKVIEEARLSIMRDSYLVINNLGELAVGQQFKNTAVGKTLALTQIAIDTAMAISSLTKNSQANPTNAVTGGISGIAQFASGMVQITGNMLKAKSILNGGGNVSTGGGGASGSAMGGGNVSSQPPRLDTFQSNRTPMNANQRVYVLEKDITDSQGRVARIRHNATLI